ncbi:MAG TPA: hypothetical protein VGO00_25835 [Kofleriaceae bacterium]|jgi:hypothetical protein|nr:hypothetical protein [Kofleriaceae bacterium]
MRKLALSLPFVALAAMPSPTDACGYVTPAVFLVSTHNFRAEHAAHTLVRIGGVVPDRIAWQRIDSRSYDGTQFAPAPALDAAMTVTLVGNGGRHVVSSAKQRFVAQDMWWSAAPATTVLDVGDVRGYQLAIRGTHDDATFHAAENIGGVDRIALSDGIVIDAIETAVDDELRVTLREKDRDVGTFPGRVLGGLDTDGGHYIVIENNGAVRAVIIWS